MQNEEQERLEDRRKAAGNMAAFNRSPGWFTLLRITQKMLKVVLWLGFFAIVAQCTCNGCVWGKV